MSFRNRLGIELVVDLYSPKRLRGRARALIVGHPFGGVKEQTSGLYAQTMAERGFVTLAFDASYNGESGGRPRHIASLETFVEDFSAAVDCLGTRRYVARDRIGVIGVCASGGFSLSAAQIDPRLKAVATVSMYDMGRAYRDGQGYAPAPGERNSVEERKRALAEAAAQRWAEFDGGKVRYGGGSAVPLKPSQQAAADEFARYYATPRGAHPRSHPLTLTSLGAIANFMPLAQIELPPRPLLFIAGEKAHSRYYSEDAYAQAPEPRELHIVPGAGHVDLYDKVDLIPWGKLTGFFDKHLRSGSIRGRRLGV
ncbi:alpha/beta hydrolase [Streptomyces sp. KAI-26]|uniref:alpha/beta hydrolase n=1 Tax=Streptomyces sp. KAI-26 TaxID=1169747 RepID=UPI0015870F68|nr:alpha/beta hydrolase [Streptomyces sp. KAI-26]NUV86181.1 alpha/beta hydrolase [Streptomyces sp. KAI-26]NUW20612.1 alpha/beta hydrolase [Streptomyces roseoviolaceus]